MPLKRLGDGSFLNTDTGELSGYDPAREAAGRRISAQMGHLPEQRRAAQQPIMNKSAANNPAVVVPTASGGEKVIIRPQRDLLAVNPFELGVGALPVMSDGTKRIVATGAIVALALGVVWVNNRFKAKPAAKYQKK